MNKLTAALQAITIVCLILLCKGLYINHGAAYIDIFPSFNEQDIRKESFKSGCIRFSMKQNDGALVVKDWDTCVKMAEEEFNGGHDSD